ncbi:MAG: glycosyltransferase [Gemmatimonadetes bacterium]|nr:glycosyltransferase [Gemmatimonadota bacterium]
MRGGDGDPAEELIILAIGSLVVRKGHAVLIDALARLEGERSVPPWRLLIAGEGVERSSLTAQAEKLGLSDRVHLLGHRLDGANLRAAADVFRHAVALGRHATAVLEAMFARRAIVASASSGISRRLSRGRCLARDSRKRGGTRRGPEATAE